MISTMLRAINHFFRNLTFKVWALDGETKYTLPS